MGPYPGHATAPPRVFNYSLDWRFLLPIADPKKLCLLFEEDADFSQTLEKVGIDVSQKLSFSDLRDRNNSRFQHVVMPFGVPVGWASAKQEDRIEFYFSVRRFIDSGGYLLVGFDNLLNWRFDLQTKYYSSTPRRIARELKQVGFKSIKIFGVMPNLQIPEYIFDLDPQTIHFALQNRFRRKPAILGLLRVVAGTIGWRCLANFLPCYFVVGVV